MNQSLTVVLPIHNAETTLRNSVDRVLEVAAELTPRFRVLIVDDASTDDSFDVAAELASRYPQVRVQRQQQRRGLGPTLQRVQKTVKSDVVMIHDGVSAMNADQLRLLWNRRVDSARATVPGQPGDVSMADLLRPSQNQAAMAAAHQRLSSFQMLPAGSSEATAGEADAPTSPPAPKMTQQRQPSGRGMGAVPPLPQTGVLGAMSDFALGE